MKNRSQREVEQATDWILKSQTEKVKRGSVDGYNCSIDNKETDFF